MQQTQPASSLNARRLRRSLPRSYPLSLIAYKPLIKPYTHPVMAKLARLPEDFPVGMKVLVVDDDDVFLARVEKMLLDCHYNVTACSRATEALSLLQESGGGFDIVLTDVHMPDMDGLKLLELIGLEMDLPVILMSVDEDTDTVMKGIEHGACDFLLKPVSIEALRNLWQHVVRKKMHDKKENLSNLEDPDHSRRISDEDEHGSSGNDASEGTSTPNAKRRNTTENDDKELENDGPPLKKTRLVWTLELHDQFVDVVKKLGNDAAPKKILELMNNPSLTRANVASHWQKYKNYLKRLSGEDQQQDLLRKSYCGAVEPNMKMWPTGLNSSPLSVLEPIPAETFPTMDNELLSQTSGTFAVPAFDQPALNQSSLQGPSCNPVPFGRPLMNYQTNMSKRFSQSNIHTGVPSNSLGGVSSHNSNILVQTVQKQRVQSFHSETNHVISKESFCMVPNQSSNSFQAGSNSYLMNQNSMLVASQLPSNLQAVNAPVCSIYNSVGFISDFSNNMSLDMGHGIEDDFDKIGLLNSYPILGATSSSVSSCTDRSANWIAQTRM